MQKEKKDPLYKSFGYAFHGIFTVIGQERNMQIHCAATVAVVFLGLFLHISYEEWLICLLLFALVMSLEMVNTAVEAAVDFAAKGERHPLAGKAKDVAAGAVLISAIFAAIIGMLIFLPKIMALIFK